MSKWDRLIIVVAIVALALFAYVLSTEQMTASLLSKQVVKASEMPDRFEEISQLVSSGSLSSNMFTGMTSDDIDDYYFIDYRIDVSNMCPLPGKWATMNIIPADGDIVVMQADPAIIAPLAGGIVTGTLVTVNPDQQRTGFVEYYVLGRMMTAKVDLK